MSFGNDHREWIEEATEIPALQEPPQRFGGNRSFGRGGGGGGFRGRGGGGGGRSGGFNRSFGGGFKSTPNKRISF